MIISVKRYSTFSSRPDFIKYRCYCAQLPKRCHHRFHQPRNRKWKVLMSEPGMIMEIRNSMSLTAQAMCRKSYALKDVHEVHPISTTIGS